MAAIELVGVSKSFGDVEVFTGLDLLVPDGDFLVVAGPSGCGKTTLLRVIAGLEGVDAGDVYFDDHKFTEIHPFQRKVAMVFQDYALYSHRTAEGNITFPLEMRKVKARHRRRRAADEARYLRIEHLLAKYPKQLSAGQQQAVATARSLVADSDVLLMDEPLANIDPHARAAARRQLKRLHRDLGTTIVYVTNDQLETMALGERIAVMNADGRLEQVDAALTVYRRPANTYVAGFIGSPPMNLLPAEVASAEDGIEVVVGADRIRLDAATADRTPALRSWRGLPIIVGIRVEDLYRARRGASFHSCLHGRVVAVQNLGTERHVEVQLAGLSTTLWARVDAADTAAVGEMIELAVALDRIAFFDPATERSL
jgi:multiple sugar transport system ATP-binding protein